MNSARRDAARPAPARTGPGRSRLRSGAGPGWRSGGTRRVCVRRSADRVEREPEHVVQDEHRPLGGLSCSSTTSSASRMLSSSVTRRPDRAGGAARRRCRGRAILGRRCRRSRRPRGAELVEAQPADDDDQPAADVVDVVEVASEQPAERLLHDVLGVGDAAEHPEREVDEVRAVLDQTSSKSGLVRRRSDDQSCAASSRTVSIVRRDSPRKCDRPGASHSGGSSSYGHSVPRPVASGRSRRDEPRHERPGPEPSARDRGAGLRKTYPGGVEAVEGIDFAVARARCSGCSDRTARASRRPSAC